MKPGGRGCPASSFSLGLGSNVSMWLGPPSRNMIRHCLARAFLVAGLRSVGFFTVVFLVAVLAWVRQADDEWSVVHGTVWSEELGRRIDHAWCEREDVVGRRGILAREHLGACVRRRQAADLGGPVNRGVELSGEAIDSPQSLIAEQVAAGLVVRMAILYELLAGAERPSSPADGEGAPGSPTPIGTSA